ncbi:MAG TPA: hypothetical protein VG271_11010 [Beijerinckiaceae bacterium]|nr:hypothetical protein [Beijerinckiaceae bacterium]
MTKRLVALQPNKRTRFFGSSFAALAALRPNYIEPENYAGGGVITTRNRAKAHPKELVAIIRALHNTTNWIYDPADKDEFFSILQSEINVTRDAFDRTDQKHLVEDKMWATDSHAIDPAMQGSSVHLSISARFRRRRRKRANSMIILTPISPPKPAPRRVGPSEEHHG